MFHKETFGIEGGTATGTCGRDGLAVTRVGDVSGGEDPLHAGMGGSAFHLYITLVVKLELSAEEVGGRFVAYCEEKSGDGYVEVLLFVGAEVADSTPSSPKSPLVLQLYSISMFSRSSTRFFITLEARR